MDFVDPIDVIHIDEVGSIWYDWHYTDRPADCILPESLYQLEQARNQEIVLKRDKSKTAESDFHDLLDLIYQNLEFLLPYRLAVEEIERFGFYFVYEEAMERLEEANDIAQEIFEELFVDQKIDFKNLTESDYEKLFAEYNGYQERIQKLVREAYEWSVPGYIKMYKEKFGDEVDELP